MDKLFNEPGLQLTIILLAIPIIFAIILMLIRVNRMIKDVMRKIELKSVNEKIAGMQPEEISALETRRQELEFQLSGNELSPETRVKDPKGIIAKTADVTNIRFLHTKRKSAGGKIEIPTEEKQLILWYLACAIFWLFVGTSVGFYLGIKFVAPDADHISWLSFGRLRPVIPIWCSGVGLRWRWWVFPIMLFLG